MGILPDNFIQQSFSLDHARCRYVTHERAARATTSRSTGLDACSIYMGFVADACHAVFWRSSVGYSSRAFACCLLAGMGKSAAAATHGANAPGRLGDNNATPAIRASATQSAACPAFCSAPIPPAGGGQGRRNRCRCVHQPFRSPAPGSPALAAEHRPFSALAEGGGSRLSCQA